MADDVTHHDLLACPLDYFEMAWSLVLSNNPDTTDTLIRQAMADYEPTVLLSAIHGVALSLVKYVDYDDPGTSDQFRDYFLSTIKENQDP